MGRKATLVVLVRHGERLDEADRFAWQQTRTHETQYDPPLTKTGWILGFFLFVARGLVSWVLVDMMVF